jgi:hypothetical protein
MLYPTELRAHLKTSAGEIGSDACGVYAEVAAGFNAERIRLQISFFGDQNVSRK